VLSALSTEDAAPYMAGVLLALGAYILVRFALRPPTVSKARTSPHRSTFLSPLGLVAGFVDASGGGGWGPVATPALLTAGRTARRTVVGSVDTSEFLVAVAASIGFLIGLGSELLDPWTIGGLLLGGVLAAPVAAWLVTKIPAPVLGTAVGGLIVLTNTRTILRAFDVADGARTPAYLIVVGVWAAAVALAVARLRRTAAEEAELAAIVEAGAAAGDALVDDRPAGSHG
jgi:uncharacterized membrane protein YfcA